MDIKKFYEEQIERINNQNEYYVEYEQNGVVFRRNVRAYSFNDVKLNIESDKIYAIYKLN